MADYCDAENKLRHYEVLSGEMSEGGMYEPPEVGRLWACLLAPNGTKAKAAALRLPDWQRWRGWASDNPFVEVTAKRFVCEHGSCIGCWPADGTCGCPDCAVDEVDAAFR